MKIAVVGAGISGLSCAWRLSAAHEVVLYEANDYFGGHTRTVDVCVDGVSHPVDTGFLVFNHRTYPELTRLLQTLDVETVASEMTFSVQTGALAGGLEWAGTDLNAVFAQRKNLFNPRFLRMLRDIVRFNRLATALATTGLAGPSNSAGQAGQPGLALGDFLELHGFSDGFKDWYLLPMAAAIWSCPPATMLSFPIATFARFCHNHGLLQVVDRPQWYTVKNGARNYVLRLLEALDDARLAEPVHTIRRSSNAHGAAQVEVTSRSGKALYDHVVIAAHSDQSMAMLGDLSSAEAAVLGAVRYQNNRAVLHTDASLLPRHKSTWAAWNYQCAPSQARAGEQDVCVHYLLNKLQPTPFSRPVMVTLNPVIEPAADTVVSEFNYAHPVFDQAAILAQQHLSGLQGQRNTWFAGAWTGYGFHEDGLRSGLQVAAAIDALSQGVSHLAQAVPLGANA